jgi:DNA polymerase elongation subunit (family B)
MGNSIYGSVVRGMSDKRKYDIKSGRTIRMEAGELSNPILASWTTAFVRSIIGECLHEISKMNGKVVSVTTDGFITDIKDLEGKLEERMDKESLLREFKESRRMLSRDDTGLEIKHEGVGIIS